MTTPKLMKEARAIGVMPDHCPDCEGKTFVLMLGEEFSCPSCCPVMYAEQLRERRIDDGQFGAGA